MTQVVFSPVSVDKSLTPIGHSTYTSGMAEWSPLPTASSQPLIATVLLPAYNEERALPAVLTALVGSLDKRYEVIVVDDGSSDATAAVAAGYPVRLIRHSHNRGKGAALRTGLQAARGEIVIVMDADNTYPVSAIPKMAALLRQHTFVRGVRQQSVHNSPFINRVGNKLFDGTLGLLYGLRGGDYLTGLYGLRRDAFQAIDLAADGFDIEAEICIKAHALGLDTGLMPISYHERIGEKKLRPFQDGWRILRRIISMALLYNPLAMFVLPGLLMWLAIVTLLLGDLARAGVVSAASGLVALVGAGAGFHFITFGVVAALYGVERGMPLPLWARALISRGSKAALSAAGAGCFIAGLSIIVDAAMLHHLSISVTSSTLSYLLASALIAVGAQLMVATLFVSIFMQRSTRRFARVGVSAARTFPLHTSYQEAA